MRKVAPGNTGAMRAATNPATVIGATAAETSRFAGIETKESCPESATMMGVQKSVAAIGIAIDSGIFSFNFGARSNIPAVAPTDNAKPGSIAWNGSIKIKIVIARPSEGRAELLSPRAFAMSRAAVMMDALKTEGLGRTKYINPTSTKLVTMIRLLSFGNIHCISHKINPEIIAKFSPLTAVKCVNPDLRISVTKAGDSKVVSPSTSPGMSAAPVPEICEASSLKCVRMDEVTRPKGPEP